MKAYIVSVVNTHFKLEKFVVFASTAEQARAWFDNKIGSKEGFYFTEQDVAEMDYNNIIRLGEYKDDIRVSKYVGMDESVNSVEEQRIYRVIPEWKED